jgi:hypothetical protein
MTTIAMIVERTQGLRSFFIAIAFLGAICGLIPAGIRAQTQLDISGCFNPLLQNQIDYKSDVRLSLATLAQINESDYELKKHDVALAGQYGIISGSADYKDFDDKRKQYFQLNKLDLQYYQSISLNTRTLDSQAYGLIKNCIDTVAANTYGFHYLYTVDGDQAASIQLFWHPTESGSSIAITDSVLTNAKAKTAGVPDGKLYPYISKWSLTPYPKIEGASNVILLERDDPSKSIHCSVSTKPQVQTLDMMIPSQKKPTSDIVCQTVYDATEPVTNRPYGDTVVWPLNVTDGHGCSDCHGYSFSLDAPGPVTDVVCTSSGDHVWQEKCEAHGNHIEAVGFQNANPRTLTIVYHYKLARQDCEFPEKAKQTTAKRGQASTLKNTQNNQ